MLKSFSQNMIIRGMLKKIEVKYGI
ncbi:hypothetical protein Zm00014a_016100 [Zea mays]|uniref:Uncharacterized protein n=1 Tax=Zea mays TaxID=4577 RepID=A0A3L6FVQ5_MAIZE|nr:hypothetical protein Zm00014a_016100 [Zea mays]